MVDFRLILLCLAECYILSFAIPPDLFGSRMLHNADVDEEYTGRLDRADTAQTIQEVLRLLFPEEEPQAAFQGLVVKEINDDTHSSPLGRVGFTDDGESSWQTRPATQDDYDSLDEQQEASKCRTPVNVTINAYKEFGIDEGYGTHIWPQCVTVPRCAADSGCCVAGEICMGVEDTQIQLPKLFLVYTIANSHVAMKNFTSYKSCSCRPDPFYNAAEAVTDSKCLQTESCPSPKIWNDERCTCECSKACPSPYAQDPDSCVCDCLHSNKLCGKIKRGLKPLASEGCQCVQNNDCGAPACRTGNFETSQCRCLST
ncbi:uncharacterized protein LOC144438640 [Glandiceps talaboti]